jgi:hypothetical protein
MPKFVEGDMVMRTTYASLWIGRIYTSFIHNKKQWYVGHTTEGLLWLCPEDQLEKFQCSPVRYVEKPNSKPGPVLSRHKY